MRLQQLGRADLVDEDSLKIAVLKRSPQVADYMVPLDLKLSQFGVTWPLDRQQGAELEGYLTLLVIDLVVLADNEYQLSARDLTWTG